MKNLAERKKEELIELLKWNRKILSPSMIDYLNSLIELDFSVLRDEYIEPAVREVLESLDVYKKIATYNIIGRAEKLLQEQTLSTRRILHPSSITISFAPIESLNILNLDYSDKQDSKIGTISLYHSTEDKNQKEEAIRSLRAEIESMKSINNPYSVNNKAKIKNKNLAYYEDRLQNLESQSEITDEDRRKAEISTRANEILLRDYDITSFDKEEIPAPAYIYAKTLEKRKNGFTIKDHIRYL